MSRPDLRTPLQVGDALPAAASCRPITRLDAGAVLRRLGRPQPDPRRHRLRARGRHARRVRARHAVGMAYLGAAAHQLGAAAGASARSTCASSPSRTWATRITCSGKVVEKFEHDGERCVRLRPGHRQPVRRQTKLAGEALVAWP